MCPMGQLEADRFKIWMLAKCTFFTLWSHCFINYYNLYILTFIYLFFMSMTCICENALTDVALDRYNQKSEFDS